MIRHIVLLRFRADVASDVRAGLMSELDALRGRLPGMTSFAAHRNASVEPHVMHGFGDGFVIDLADAAARDAYLADPQHRDIGARLSAACEQVIVFDHEL